MCPCRTWVGAWEATWKLRVLLTKNGRALLWELESLTATRRSRNFRSKKWNGGSKFSKNLYKCYWNRLREIWNRKSTAILESTVLKNNFFFYYWNWRKMPRMIFQVPPYPKFEPRISLKRDGSVLVNSGNLLYLLDFQLEKLKHDDDGEHREKSRLLLQQVWQQPGSDMFGPCCFRFLFSSKSTLGAFVASNDLY